MIHAPARWSSAAALAIVQCACAGHTAALPDGSASDAGGGEASIPATSSCTGAASGCLHGTAAPSDFVATPSGMQVEVYAVFPSVASAHVATVTVARDGTWAVSDLPASGHYYVQLLADFGQPHAIASLVGPVHVPATSPLALSVRPVQVQALEQEAGGVSTLVWVEAHVFDRSSGAELAGTATVSLSLGGAAVNVPWGSHGPSDPAYFVDLPAGTPAQASYSGSAAIPGADGPATLATWQLVPSPPTFTPSLGSPTNGATIAASQPLDVRWAAQSLADYELLELLQQVGGGWSPVYASPTPEPPTTTSLSIPASALASAGAYLLDVDFLTASCPATANGCALASTVADAQLTAQ